MLSLLAAFTVNAATISSESAKTFINMAEEAQRGNLPDEEAWSKLWATDGYKKFFSTWNPKDWCDDIKAGFDVAFNPANAAKRDSVLANRPDMVTSPTSDWIAYNFCHLSTRMPEVHRFINETDFSAVAASADSLARTWLPKFVVPHTEDGPSFCLLAFDCESRASDHVFIDVNSASLEGDDGFLKLMGHELHHTYVSEVLMQRYDLAALEVANPDWVMEILLHCIMEGTADLISKETMPTTSMGLYGPAAVDAYNAAYNASPATLKALDELVVSHKNGAINDESYGQQLISGPWYQGDGHPVGDYIMFAIRDVFGKEAVADCAFDIRKTISLYNQAAEKIGGYQFSPEFISVFDNMLIPVERPISD